ncbi:MAG: glycerol-3-phosphate 1-O-acyltransferase PlsY [Synergistaceae bacterium]|nr:glycerol-3-phosphate 1-O-acyltransferase PlsY [Synergistaceae bacterium]
MILWAIVSYLIGSFPTGYVVTKLFHKDESGKRDGLDIRSIGSGAIGATNVGRAMGPVWSWFTAIVDMLKGAFALLLAAHIAPSESQETIMALAGFAVVLGHIFPVWLKFKGGKGVATSYGTIFFIWPYYSFAVVLLCAAIWYIIRGTTRYVSLASMVSLSASALFLAMLGAPGVFIMLAAGLSALVIFSHRENIVRLINGTENKFKG